MARHLAEGYELTAIKRKFIPEWLFAIAVYGCRLFETDINHLPRLRWALVTEQFHYHDLGKPIYGKKCRKCPLAADDAMTESKS